MSNQDRQVEVLVVEDHPAVRKGLELLLQASGLRIAGIAGDVAAATGMVSRRRFDVALVDLNLPDGSGLEVVQRILAQNADHGVVLHTGEVNPARLDAASAAGAQGFVLKSSQPDQLVTALTRVAAGGTYVDPGLAVALSTGQSLSRLPTLTPREREMLDLLAEGLTGEDIAQKLCISSETVRTHVRNATTTLGAKTRVQAVALLLRASGARG